MLKETKNVVVVVVVIRIFLLFNVHVVILCFFCALKKWRGTAKQNCTLPPIGP